MKPYYWVIVAGAVILALPLAVTPSGWMLVAVFVGLWLLITTVGKWAAGEYVDLKKSREMGRDGSTDVSDLIGGLDDDDRWRR